MFYEEKEINDIIICQYCKLKYKDPRILPCGRSLCFDCIELLINKDENKIETIHCPICNENHEKPEIGFYKNIELAKLAEKKSTEVYRSKKTELLKTKLKQVKTNTDFIHKGMQMESTIIEHCGSLKNEVQVATEILHDKINKLYQQLIKRIENYEKTAIKAIDQQSKKYFTELYEDMNEFYGKWTEYLNQLIISDNEVVEALNEADKYLYNYNCEMKYKTFNGEMLKFYANRRKFDSNLIGVLRLEPLDYIPKYSSENIKTTNLKEVMNDISHLAFKVEPLNNSQLVIVYENKQSNLNMVLIDHQANVILKKVGMIEKKIFEVKNFKLASLNKDIFVFIAYKETPSLETCSLRKYDESFKLTLDKNIGLNIINTTVYRNQLFLLSSSPALSKNVFYFIDKSLNNLKRIGFNFGSIPFTVPPKVKKFQVNCNFCIYLDNKEIKFMNRVTGAIDKTLLIDYVDFNLYLDKYIMVYNQSTRFLTCFDFTGVICNNEKLDNVSANSKLICNINKKLFFLDTVSFIVEYF